MINTLTFLSLFPWFLFRVGSFRKTLTNDAAVELALSMWRCTVVDLADGKMWQSLGVRKSLVDSQCHMEYWSHRTLKTYWFCTFSAYLKYEVRIIFSFSRHSPCQLVNYPLIRNVFLFLFIGKIHLQFLSSHETNEKDFSIGHIRSF